MMQTAPVPTPLERHALPELKHSGLGIASFVLSLVLGLTLFVLIGLAAFQEMSAPGGIDENSPITMILGLLLIGAMLLNLVGAALGVAGLLQKDRRRIFAVLGVVFNLLAILGTVGLMIAGSVMES